MSDNDTKEPIIVGALAKSGKYKEKEEEKRRKEKKVRRKAWPSFAEELLEPRSSLVNMKVYGHGI